VGGLTRAAFSYQKGGGLGSYLAKKKLRASELDYKSEGAIPAGKRKVQTHAHLANDDQRDANTDTAYQKGLVGILSVAHDMSGLGSARSVR
jgi:hypothetical protein